MQQILEQCLGSSLSVQLVVGYYTDCFATRYEMKPCSGTLSVKCRNVLSLKAKCLAPIESHQCAKTVHSEKCVNVSTVQC